jgi:hypothetical protein
VALSVDAQVLDPARARTQSGKNERQNTWASELENTSTTGESKYRDETPEAEHAYSPSSRPTTYFPAGETAGEQLPSCSRGLAAKVVPSCSSSPAKRIPQLARHGTPHPQPGPPTTNDQRRAGAHTMEAPHNLLVRHSLLVRPEHGLLGRGYIRAMLGHELRQPRMSLGPPLGVQHHSLCKKHAHRLSLSLSHTHSTPLSLARSLPPTHTHPHSLKV